MKKAEFHIVPVNDTEEHVMNSSCKCNPRIQEDKVTFCVKHRSFDGREGLEAAREALGLEAPDNSEGWDLILVKESVDRPSGAIIIFIDYEEYKPETYKGVYLLDGGVELFRVFTGDCPKDYYAALKKGMDMAYKQGKVLYDSSSVAHWQMDTDI